MVATGADLGGEKGGGGGHRKKWILTPKSPTLDVVASSAKYLLHN